MATFEETLDKAIEVAVKRAVKRAKLEAHPVGSLYLSLTSDNPKDLFGGGHVGQSRFWQMSVGCRQC